MYLSLSLSIYIYIYTYTHMYAHTHTQWSAKEHFLYPESYRFYEVWLTQQTQRLWTCFFSEVLCIYIYIYIYIYIQSSCSCCKNTLPRSRVCKHARASGATCPSAIDIHTNIHIYTYSSYLVFLLLLILYCYYCYYYYYYYTRAPLVSSSSLRTKPRIAYIRCKCVLRCGWWVYMFI